MKRPFYFVLSMIGRKGFAVYLLCALGLMAPSFRLWFEPSWNIMEREFDFWAGWAPHFSQENPENWKLYGNLLQSVLFLIGGLGFWASFLEMKKDLAQGKKDGIWLKIGLVLGIFSLGIPWFSVDCFFYLAKGWLETHYGVDVYQAAIDSVPGYRQDIFFQNVYHTFIPELGDYGPLFQYFMKTVTWLGQGNFKLTFLLLRIVFLVALLASAWIIAHLAGKKGLPPLLTAYVFLCNPLVAFNLVTAVHNDSISNLLVLVAVLFAWDRRAFGSGLFLGLGVAWKFVPLLLLPPFLLYFLWHERKLSLGHFLTFIFAALLSFSATFLLYPSAFVFFTSVASGGLPGMRSSPALFISAVLSPFYEMPEAVAISRKIMIFLFMGSSAVLLFPYFIGKRIMRPESLVFVCFLIFLLYNLIGASQVEEWYFTWFFVLGFILDDKKVQFLCVFLGVFYMPWVNFMLYESGTVMLLSQSGACLVFTAAALWLIGRPLLFWGDWRNKMLGPTRDSVVLENR